MGYMSLHEYIGQRSERVQLYTITHRCFALARATLKPRDFRGCCTLTTNCDESTAFIVLSIYILRYVERIAGISYENLLKRNLKLLYSLYVHMCSNNIALQSSYLYSTIQIEFQFQILDIKSISY